MIETPYLLFLGDAPDALAAKVAQGIKDWRPEYAVGQFRMEGCKADMGLPDMDLAEAKAAGCKTLVIGVANRGGIISPAWKKVLVAALEEGFDLASGLHNLLRDEPDLVAVAKEIFDKGMPTPNQIHIKREHRKITEADLIEPPIGIITENGVRKNINVGVLYLASWLNGQGAAALHNLMEDAATAEISRSQLWQWLQNKVILDNGRKLDLAYYHELALDEFRKIKEELGEENHEKQQFPLAEKVLESARVSINAEKAAAVAELKAQMAAFSIEIAEKVVRENLSSDEKQKALAEKLAGEINLN